MRSCSILIQIVPRMPSCPHPDCTPFIAVSNESGARCHMPTNRSGIRVRTNESRTVFPYATIKVTSGIRKEVDGHHIGTINRTGEFIGCKVEIVARTVQDRVERNDLILSEGFWTCSSRCESYRS